MRTEKKSGRTFKFAALLLVAALVSSVMISGTFAKYTSEYSGQDTALVAKWDIKATEGNVEGTGANVLGTHDLDLFSHAYNTYIQEKAGSGEPNEGSYIIAPGVSGKFVLNVKNDSDVAARIGFSITRPENTVNVPMEFSLYGNFSSLLQFSDDSSEQVKDLGNRVSDIAEPGGTVTETVYWRWAYDGDDSNDTALGLESTSSAAISTGERTKYTLKVTATATQVQPTE